MQFIVLAILFIWLFVCLPQDAFLWASTTHEQYSFDWWMGYGRALLLGFMPILSIWAEGILITKHIEVSKKEYNKKERAWNRKERKYGAEWAETHPLLDEDEFIDGHSTAAARLSRWAPVMFFLLNSVISLSYLGYYEEHGKDIKMFHIEWWNFPVGDYILRPLVILVRTGITWIVSYVLGRIAAVFGVQNLPTDLKNFFNPPQEQALAKAPRKRPVSSKIVEPKRLQDSTSRRKKQIIQYVQNEDPEQRGLRRKDIFTAILGERDGRWPSSIYDEVKDLVESGQLRAIGSRLVTWADENDSIEHKPPLT